MRATRSSIAVRSPAFLNGGTIPTRFTCAGENDWPPLRWGSAPDGTGQLALVMRDLDAGSRGVVHWVVIELPPATRGILPTAGLPPGADQLPNQLGTRSYRGPCPAPGGNAHRYAFTLYALSARPNVSLDSPASEARAAIARAAQAHWTLVGRYSRPRAGA